MATYVNPSPLTVFNAAGITNAQTTNLQSTGKGVGAISATVTGRVRLSFSAEIGNGTAGDGSSVAIYRNATGVPTAGTNVGADTAIWTAVSTFVNLASAPNVYAVTATVYDTSPVAGSFYYVAIKSLTGGTTTISNLSLTAEEA